MLPGGREALASFLCLRASFLERISSVQGRIELKQCLFRSVLKQEMHCLEASKRLEVLELAHVSRQAVRVAA